MHEGTQLAWQVRCDPSIALTDGCPWTSGTVALLLVSAAVAVSLVIAVAAGPTGAVEKVVPAALFVLCIAIGSGLCQQQLVCISAGSTISGLTSSAASTLR